MREQPYIIDLMMIPFSFLAFWEERDAPFLHQHSSYWKKNLKKKKIKIKILQIIKLN